MITQMRSTVPILRRRLRALPACSPDARTSEWCNAGPPGRARPDRDCRTRCGTPSSADARHRPRCLATRRIHIRRDSQRGAHDRGRIGRSRCRVDVARGGAVDFGRAWRYPSGDTMRIKSCSCRPGRRSPSVRWRWPGCAIPAPARSSRSTWRSFARSHGRSRVRLRPRTESASSSWPVPVPRSAPPGRVALALERLRLAGAARLPADLCHGLTLTYVEAGSIQLSPGGGRRLRRPRSRLDAVLHARLVATHRHRPKSRHHRGRCRLLAGGRGVRSGQCRRTAGRYPGTERA